jgi:hypothetical protein
LFFVLDEGVEFIHLDHLHLRGLRNGWQLGRMGFHPVADTLVADAQQSTDPAQVYPIDVHPNGLPSDVIPIAVLFGFRCVFCAAYHAPITLTPCLGEPRFVLSRLALAFWTLHHASIVPQAHHLLHSPYLKSMQKDSPLELEVPKREVAVEAAALR